MWGWGGWGRWVRGVVGALVVAAAATHHQANAVVYRKHQAQPRVQGGPQPAGGRR